MALESGEIAITFIIIIFNATMLLKQWFFRDEIAKFGQLVTIGVNGLKEVATGLTGSGLVPPSQLKLLNSILDTSSELIERVGQMEIQLKQINGVEEEEDLDV